MGKIAFITGISGQDGSYLAELLVKKKYKVFGICNPKKKVNYENDDKVKLILVGTASIILFQTFIHIGVNIRMLPTTGMTLPFLSYGGSSIISTSILSGIILNLTRRKVNK